MLADRCVIDIRGEVSDGRAQRRSFESIQGVAVHRVGVDVVEGIVIGHDAESICRAFTGRDPSWPTVAKATGGQNPYSFYVGGSHGGMSDGVIWQTLDITEIGWHARSASRSYLGVALIGDFRSGAGDMPSRWQMDSLIWLLSGLCAALSIGPSMVRGHGEIPGAHSGEKSPGAPYACPGDLVDMGRVRAAVAAASTLGCKDAARMMLESAGASFA